MKLTDLDNSRRNNVYKALKEHYELPFNVDKMPLASTRAMLQKVRGLMTESKQSSDFYESQSNPAYMKLVFMEQALADHFAELRMQPKPRIVVENEEVEKSQVVLAAQDMCDQVQKMIEEVSDMLVKELPALTSGVQSEIGVNESETFNQQVTEALTSLQASLTQSKGTLQSALNSITGQGGNMMGAPADDAFGGDDMAGDMGMPAPDMGGEEDISVDDDISIEEPEEEIPMAAGRAKR
jgi:hypothetical protein